jgi:hypothetical protein
MLMLISHPSSKIHTRKKNPKVGGTGTLGLCKGLVSVKEYESHTERLRVEQDKLKVECEEEKRNDLEVV